MARAEAVWADGTASVPANDGQTGQAADRRRDASASGDAAGGHVPADPRLAGWREPLRSSWNVRAILAVAVPAVILLIVSLV